MIEVIPHGNGWRWRWICALGRTLVECYHCHESDIAAWNAAKDYRIAFWGRADWIDHRMGACI